MTKKEYARVCLVCNKPYVATNHNSRLCSEACRRKRNIELCRESRIRAKAEAELTAIKKARKKSLTELAVEAREHGMTYGKYVEWLRSGEEKKK